jgi:hypothetical protein
MAKESTPGFSAIIVPIHAEDYEDGVAIPNTIGHYKLAICDLKKKQTEMYDPLCDTNDEMKDSDRLYLNVRFKRN